MTALVTSNLRGAVNAYPIPAETRKPRLQPSGPGISSVSATRVGDLNIPQRVPEAEREQLIIEHMPVVRSIAAHICSRLPVSVDLDDLVQTGTLGLLAAAEKFVPNGQAVFGTYARHRIKGAILDSLRQLDGASRGMRRRKKQVVAATDSLIAVLGRAPTELEIAEKLGIDIAGLRQMMLHMPIQMFSFSTPMVPDVEGNTPVQEFPGKLERQPDSLCASKELQRLLESAIQTLPERQQTVVRLYYMSDMTMKEISFLLGVNESRISQIHKSALAKMAVILEKNGISSTCIARSSGLGEMEASLRGSP